MSLVPTGQSLIWHCLCFRLEGKVPKPSLSLQSKWNNWTLYSLQRCRRSFNMWPNIRMLIIHSNIRNLLFICKYSYIRFSTSFKQCPGQNKQQISSEYDRLWQQCKHQYSNGSGCVCSYQFVHVKWFSFKTITKD